jgi:RiboL-PSP-HEPN
MSFATHFSPHLTVIDRLTSDVLRNAPVSSPAADEFRADLAGLLVTSYFAAYECCVKSIFVNFASSKNKLLASVIGRQFEKISGRIKLQIITDEYARQFGETYRTRLVDRIKLLEDEIMGTERLSAKASFENLIDWRHQFAHAGKRLATLEEVIATEKIARGIIWALDEVMSY